MPAEFLYNLTKNLTAHLQHNLCAVLPKRKKAVSCLKRIQPGTSGSPLHMDRTARNYYEQHLLSGGAVCSKADHGAEIRVTAFLYTIIEQIVNLFNAIIEQKNDIIAQKELLPRDGSSSQRGISK